MKKKREYPDHGFVDVPKYLTEQIKEYAYKRSAIREAQNMLLDALADNTKKAEKIWDAAEQVVAFPRNKKEYNVNWDFFASQICWDKKETVADEKEAGA